MNLKKNWTVLLRERKRHTDRSVASTPSVVLTVGYPIPDGGYPHLGYPPSRFRQQGVPGVSLIQIQTVLPHPWDTPRVPPIQSWLGYPQSRPGWGTSLSGPGPSIPHNHLDLAGVPPSGQTDGWMDRHVSKIALPSYYVRGAVIILQKEKKILEDNPTRVV